MTRKREERFSPDFMASGRGLGSIWGERERERKRERDEKNERSVCSKSREDHFLLPDNTTVWSTLS